MKLAYPCLVLATLTLTLAACSSNRVASRPTLKSPSGHSMVSSDRMQIKVHFNQPVDHRTLIPGKTFIVSTEKHENVRGSLHWSADRRSIIFRSFMTLDELFTFDPHGHFNLRIIGTNAGQGAVIDRDGQYLDGDNDDVPGGNYDVAMELPLHGQRQLQGRGRSGCDMEMGAIPD